MSNRLRGIIFVLISGCCWGFHGILIKYAFSMGASFVQVFFWEVLIASVFFAFWGRSFFSGLRPRGTRHWISLGAIGLATIGVGNFLFLSYSLGPVAIPATLMFLYLPVVYLVGIFRGHQVLSKWKVLAISLVLLGAVFTTEIVSSFREEGALASVLTAMAASMCYAVVFILTPGIGNFTSAEFRSFAISAFALVGCLLILFLKPDLWMDLGDNAWKFAGLALVLGAVGQTLPVIMLMKGLPLTGSSLGGMLASIELPIAVFSSALLLGESMSVLKVCGVCLVLGGIAFYNFSDKAHVLAEDGV